MCECDDAPGPHGGHLHRRRFLQAAGAGAAMLIGSRVVNPIGVAGADDNHGTDGGEDSGAKKTKPTTCDRCSARGDQRAPADRHPPLRMGR